MKRWETMMAGVGAVIFLASAFVLGNSALNIVGAVLILFPTVLFVVRYLEDKITSRPAQ